MEKVELFKLKKLDFKVDEAFKTLRTNIQFSGNSLKVILLTSCMPDEGKSSVSFCLASSFAETDKRVLLIDADIRRSVLIGQYKVTKKVFGLSHYLTGKKSLNEVLYETNIDNLDIMFTGFMAPNPSELLGSTEFEEMIAKVRELYDYVIIDSAPLGSVIDSALIAKSCDGAVLVMESGGVSYKLARRVKEQLERSGCKILGGVLNKVDVSAKSYYGSYYGKYYGSYYGNRE